MNYGFIENNLIVLKKNVTGICSRINRNPSEIHIIAISKTFPAEAVASAIDYDQLDFGENKVQELVEKHNYLDGRILNWHLVGHLQTNKVKNVVPFVYLIHSVDSFKLALKINDEASKINRSVKCLIQVNTSNEDQKSGVDVKHALKLVKEISELKNVKIKGFMTLAKFIDDYGNEDQRKIVRANFKTLKGLFDEVKSMNILNVDIKYLSMGMTSDYDMALEEGSNMIRIGTAIFGNRTVN
jgi:pyridoxal phosphate enzyme (YggS family)